MGHCSEQQVLALLAIVFVLIAQCQSTTIYKCNNETNACGCSRRPHISLKIHGGQSALFSNWDWMVSMRDLNHHFCGGSILNEWYIITAAHCFKNRTNITSSMTVCAGTFRLSDPCHQRRTMHSVIIHPLYNKTTIENDIALVRLTTPLDFSDHSLTPICLPSAYYPDEYPAVGTQVVSIGWGDLKSNATPDILQEVTLQIMSTSSIYCYHLSNDRTQLCAGGLGKGTLLSQIHTADSHITLCTNRYIHGR
jgi:secreted trypsin-like serine protease